VVKSGFKIKSAQAHIVGGQDRVPELQFSADPQHIRVSMPLHYNAIMLTYLLNDKQAGSTTIECCQMG
jgi:hypothetical protein